MKTPFISSRKFLVAFTLIELLVVIAIIAILAAMLFPAINKAKVSAQKAKAKTDIANIGMAISKYESDYNGRLPAPGVPTGIQDVTYGFSVPPLLNHTSFAGNRQVIAVLLNLERFGDGTVSSNLGNVYNPRGLTALNASTAKDVNSGGVGPDGEYRDPWGLSYVISMDTSLNDRCRDNLYSRTSVALASGTTGLYGLTNPDNAADGFAIGGQFMVWSRGPDGLATNTFKANLGVNFDNVLGWQP